MHKILLILFCFVSFSFSQNKEILLLHSYNKGLKWSDNISKGVDDVMKEHLDYEVTTEYMDSKKIDTQDYFNILLKLYKKKFAKRNYEIIIVADNYAYLFALKYHDVLFKNKPIVFCGVENFKENEIPSNIKSLVSGIIEFKEVRKNIKMIRQLIPNLNTLYVISDNSYSSKRIKKQVLKAIEDFSSDFNIVFDDEIDTDTIEEKINALPAQSAVLYTSLYKDKFGDYIPYNKIRELFKNSKFPVFALNKMHLKEGVVGGLMVDPRQQGYEAAKKAFQIINNEILSKPKFYKVPSKYYFDYETFRKYNIVITYLPKSAIIVNHPKTFMEEHRRFVDSVFAMMPFLLILLMGLIFNIVKRIKLEVKLLEQNQLDNVLLNNIKSAIYWQGKDKKLLGCNQSFCYLLNRTKAELLGQNIEDILPEVYAKIKHFDLFLCDEIEMTLTFNEQLMNLFFRRKLYFDKKGNEAGIVTLISDVTNVRNLELKNKKNEQYMVQRSKSSEIGEMITSIAHQWKSPLIEISTIAQELLLKRKKREINTIETKEFVDDIMIQVGYMTKTIDDFRMFIKPSSKKEYFQVKSAIEELLNVIEHNIKFNYIDMSIKYEDNQDFELYGYPNEFKQSILNIINNAKDSILKKRESVEFQGEINIDIFKRSKRVIIQIQDNGIGIKEENLTKIFEPFYTSKINGDGFGLYMVRLIIEDKMKGTIEAKASKQGALIEIKL